MFGKTESLVSEPKSSRIMSRPLSNLERTEGRVAFVTGGAGSICSAQTRALVALGANACIIGRNQQKTEAAAADIATARKGAKVIGIGGCDVRNVRSFLATSASSEPAGHARVELTVETGGEFESRCGALR